MSKKFLLLALLVITFLMTVCETYWIGDSAWAWFIVAVLVLADLTLFYLFTKEAAIKLKPLAGVLLVVIVVVVMVVPHFLVENTTVQSALGVPYHWPKMPERPSNAPLFPIR